MARPKKKKSSTDSSADPLLPGVEAFDAGDYAEARRRLAPLADDPELSEAQRQQARDTVAATRLERGAVLVGLACIMLFAIAVIFTAFKQP